MPNMLADSRWIPISATRIGEYKGKEGLMTIFCIYGTICRGTLFII